jgi:hypothetical protein
MFRTPEVVTFDALIVLVAILLVLVRLSCLLPSRVSKAVFRWCSPRYSEHQ